MRGARKFLLWSVCLCAASAAAVPALSAGRSGAPAAGASVALRIAGTGQSSILKRGLRVRLSGGGAVAVAAFSSSFDRPKPSRLTKTRSVRPRGGALVILPLTRRGRRAVRSCEARTLLVRAGGSSAKALLTRTTKACRPRPLDLRQADRCDFIGQQRGSLCLLPFPDDYYTAATSTATGRRIDLRTPAMPANSNGVHIDAAAYNRNDGFSPGQTILARIPGLDSPAAISRTDPVPINQIGRYAEAGQPVVVLDAATGKRWPVWAEIDSNAGSAAKTLLEIHPATNFASGHRYIVALRDLRTAGGKPIGAPMGFRYYRDRLPSKRAQINRRRSHFESLFRSLRGAGVRRSDLYLAWDFTVASDENIAARALHIRNDAFAALGDSDLANQTVEGDAPAFQVSAVDEFTPIQNAEIARRVRGTFTVPCYLEPDCGPGGRFQLGAGGLPTRNGDYSANFDCVIPRAAIDDPGAAPGRPAPYGHGLFGSASEVFNSSAQRALAEQYDMVFCATDEIGMSSGDVGNAATHILPNLSNFPELADRLQQGLLNEMYLGRLMLHPDGFLSDAAFHVDPNDDGSADTIDTGELYYVGASQGGIMGGALTALEPDATRSALNVPAMNYSVLLPRSVDYDTYSLILNAHYTDPMARPLILDLVQMLWDRGEPNGYAHRMTTDPLPGTPPHKVLMNVAFGDHQVTNFQADVEARTIGASTHQPVLDPGRWPGVDVLWNVPRLAAGDYPFDGSGIVYGDIGPIRPDDITPNPNAMIGVAPPPLTNTPNRQGEDPHGAPRGAPLALQLISDFLMPSGAITNVCGLEACHAGGWTGPP